MLFKRKQGWELPESAATDEAHYANRRQILKALGLGGAILAAPALFRMGGHGADEMAEAPAEVDPTAGLYPVARNPAYTVERALSTEREVLTYNNFYEFGSHKSIWRAAQALPLRPWEIRIDGLVEKPFTIALDDLLAKMPLEERVYRHRCVEAWAMTVPWSGFPLKALVDLARPLGSAKYLAMQTFADTDFAAPGHGQSWYPWPYLEGLAIDEATNDLAFIATGLYGKPIAKQNGAPLRLAVPWKYGFKSIKSLVRFTFTEERPKSFWETLQASEYGFWANVNPAVPHRRWSQASERLLGTGERVPTRIYNGYGEFVAGLYTGRKGERLFT